MIRIQEHIVIPEQEYWFEFAHTPGPGGQHANKASTQATLCFALLQSSAFSEEQKRRIAERLHSRIHSDGVLRIVCRQFRSQAANRAQAIERLTRLLTQALRPTKPRRPTRPTAASREVRLAKKRRRGELKRLRGPLGAWE